MVVCGTGTNDTRHSIELTKAAAEAGADAALVVTPYYNKPNLAGIVAHFEAIAEAVPDLPLIAYNIPSRVVVNVSTELTRRAGQDRQRGRRQAGQQRRTRPDRRAWRCWPATTTIFLRTLELGLAGGILVASHLVGPQMREIWDAVEAGDLERAREIDATLQPALRRDRRHHQPDPGQGGARDDRADPHRHAAAADGRARRAAARRRAARRSRASASRSRRAEWPRRSCACSRSAGWGRSART